MKVGKVEFVPPYDHIRESGILRIALLGDDGRAVGHVEIAADAVADKDQADAFHAFSFSIEEAQRKPGYLEAYPDNAPLVDLEMQKDQYEWNFRQRRGRPRWAGLGDVAVRECRMQE